MTINSCVGDVKKSTLCEVLKTSWACELFQTLFSRPNIKEKKRSGHARLPIRVDIDSIYLRPEIYTIYGVG